MLSVCFLILSCTVSTEAQDKNQDAAWSLSLSDAVRMALDRNPTLAQSRCSVQLSASELRLAKDRFSFRLDTSTDQSLSIYPDDSLHSGDTKKLNQQLRLGLEKKFATTGGSVEVFSSLNRSRFLNGGETDLTAPGDDYTHNYGIEITQPLLKGAGRKVGRAPLTAAERTMENSKSDDELARRQMIFQVISTYYRVMKTQQLLEVYRRGVDVAGTHLKQTRLKLEEGLVAQIDVSQAELQLAQKQNAFIAAQNSAQQAMDDLRQLLNLDRNSQLELTETVSFKPESIQIEAAVSEALSNRLELKKLYNQLQNRKLDIAVSRNSRLPQLDLSLKGEWAESGDAFSDVFQSDTPEYVTALSLNFTFGDKQHREELYRNEVRYKQLQSSLTELKNRIIREVTAAVRDYETMKQSIAVREKSVKVAEYGFQLANESYSEGLIRNIDLLKAQDELLQEKSSYISELMDFTVAKAKILLRIGREIDPDHLSLEKQIPATEAEGNGHE